MNNTPPTPKQLLDFQLYLINTRHPGELQEKLNNAASIEDYTSLHTLCREVESIDKQISSDIRKALAALSLEQSIHE